MHPKSVLFCICSIIAFAAFANLVRFLWDIPVTIGSIFLPGWTGGVLFILIGLISAWGFRALALVSQPPSDPSNP